MIPVLVHEREVAMADVRVGIVGLGIMGAQHAAYLAKGLVSGAVLSAVATRDPARRAAFTAGHPGVQLFAGDRELLASKCCDVLLIATPHYDHPRLVGEAFAAGLHVMVEKPLAVSVQAAREIAAEAEKHPHLCFGIMYNQRTNPLYQKVRALIAEGALGRLTRMTWIITNWFRPDAYYQSSSWRATWAGEGGGVLINQSIHNLDLLQWMTGAMPTRITAVAATGKTHPIEVEDEVSAILEYRNGAVGHFITTTGEFPGSNRLEIAGSRGRILCENDRLTFTQTTPSVEEFRRTSIEPFGKPESVSEEFTFPANPVSEHQRLMQDFVDVVRDGKGSAGLLAPGVEGVRALELANGMLMAGLMGKAVELPLDGAAFEAFLQGKIAASGRGK